MSKVIIYTDGASKGNPGAAGIGVVVSDAEGNILTEIGEYIGIATNNYAEYSALIRGLEEAINLNADEVEISTDSELMARQLSGVYKVKSDNLKELYAKAMTILQSFRRATVSHVVREHNRLADKLANDGVKKAQTTLKPKTKRPVREKEPAPPPVSNTDDEGQIDLFS